MAEPVTPSQTVGPFFGFALPFPDGPEAAGLSAGATVRIEGQLLDGEGRPVPDGMLEIWQGSQFARCCTDPEGSFHFLVSKPSRVAADAAQAPHLNLFVFARGLLRHLATRVYFADEAEANAADPVLARLEPDRRQTLLAAATDGIYHFDVRLQGEAETVFFEL